MKIEQRCGRADRIDSNEMFTFNFIIMILFNVEFEKFGRKLCNSKEISVDKYSDVLDVRWRIMTSEFICALLNPVR